MRLPNGAPAKLALKEAERQCPMPRGRRRTIVVFKGELDKRFG